MTTRHTAHRLYASQRTCTAWKPYRPTDDVPMVAHPDAVDGACPHCGTSVDHSPDDGNVVARAASTNVTLTTSQVWGAEEIEAGRKAAAAYEKFFRDPE